jgi:hypothetical protein
MSDDAGQLGFSRNRFKQASSAASSSILPNVNGAVNEDARNGAKWRAEKKLCCTQRVQHSDLLSHFDWRRGCGGSVVVT